MTASISPFSDTTDVIKAIHHADPILPIHVIISTAGGSLVGCKTILRHLRKHPAGYVVYCNEAYSAGAILSISSDQIVMDEYSHLGKIDPSFGGYEAIILKQLYYLRASENTTSYLTHDMLRSISLLNSLEKMLKEFVPNYSNMETTIKDNLIYSNLSHFESFNYDEMGAMGFNVRKPESHELIYFGYFQAK
jgi:membrane-bound ClpP family serine protease